MANTAMCISGVSLVRCGRNIDEGRIFARAARVGGCIRPQHAQVHSQHTGYIRLSLLHPLHYADPRVSLRSMHLKRVTEHFGKLHLAIQLENWSRTRDNHILFWMTLESVYKYL